MVRLNANGKLDGRYESSQRNAANARKTLKTYIEKGKKAKDPKEILINDQEYILEEITDSESDVEETPKIKETPKLEEDKIIITPKNKLEIPENPDPIPESSEKPKGIKVDPFAHVEGYIPPKEPIIPIETPIKKEVKIPKEEKKFNIEGYDKNSFNQYKPVHKPFNPFQSQIIPPVQKKPEKKKVFSDSEDELTLEEINSIKIKRYQKKINKLKGDDISEIPEPIKPVEKKPEVKLVPEIINTYERPKDKYSNLMLQKMIASFNK